MVKLETPIVSIGGQSFSDRVSAAHMYSKTIVFKSQI